MKHLLASIVLISLTAPAWAETTCTTEPKQKWMTEAAMQKKLADDGYKIRKFKISRGNCYEIYGAGRNDKKIEIYLNPVDGKIVKQKQDD